MYSKGVPVVSARLVNNYKVYEFAVGDAIEMTVRWAYPEQDEVIFGTVAAVKLEARSQEWIDECKGQNLSDWCRSRTWAILDNIPTSGYEEPPCAMIDNAEDAFSVAALLVKVETAVEGSEEPVVTYHKIPVDRIYAIEGEPVETIKVVLGVNVVDGDDGVTPVTKPVKGQKLTANIVCSDKEIGSYPADPDAVYSWYDADAPDNILGTEAVYTVTSDTVGRHIAVKVTVNGYDGQAIWESEPAPGIPTWPNDYDNKDVI